MVGISVVVDEVVEVMVVEEMMVVVELVDAVEVHSVMKSDPRLTVSRRKYFKY